jgi:hypothetical protein
MKFMYQLKYIHFFDFRNLQIEMHVVHPRQVIVVGTVRRPIDAVVLQILKLIPKVPGSSMSRRVLEQVSGRPFDTIWRPQLRVGTVKWMLLSSTPAPSIKYEQNMILSTTTSEVGALVRLCNRSAPDMTDRGWNTSKRALPAPSYSLPLVRWASR